VVNLWLIWRCPLSLVDFVASAPFTPLLKHDGGIHLNAGTIWRRLVSKVDMNEGEKNTKRGLNCVDFFFYLN